MKNEKAGSDMDALQIVESLIDALVGMNTTTDFDHFASYTNAVQKITIEHPFSDESLDKISRIAKFKNLYPKIIDLIDDMLSDEHWGSRFGELRDKLKEIGFYGE